MRRQLFLVAVLVLASFGIAQAQIQSGVLIGEVKSSDGQPLPGATVTIKSPALQGARTAVSDANGGYIFKGIPPGAYTITFELTGMSTVEQKATVLLGSTIPVNSTLSVATVQETVTVTASAASILSTSQVSVNLTGKEIDSLATGRTLSNIAELAPGLTDNTPNAGQVTIGGSFAYDNVFLIDGVDTNDNLFGTSNNLFIEDAIEETQVLTSGISAEFGRFSGGVINAVTKRGGNSFSGSYRLDLTKPSWRDETPLEDTRNITRPSKLSKFHQATLGGPIVKDKVWFFGAGRWESSSTAGTFNFTNIPFESTNDNKRYEGKLTASLSPNHTVQGSYVRNSTDQTQPTFSFSIDPKTIYSRSLPNQLFVVNYNGVLSSKVFAEAQYSEKKFQFKNAGGTDTNIRTGSPFFDFSTGSHYNAPYFDATDPEDRNNRQMMGNLSYFASTSSFGRHDLKAGYENFRSTRTGGNSQSPTSFVFYADYDLVGSTLSPIWETGTNLIINWRATRGAQIDITTQSFYVNDKWQINDKWSANIGARYEKVRAEATGGITSVDTDTIVPRMALSYDVKGDGKWRLDATYAHYAGKYSEAQFANNTSVGNPAYVYLLYLGPNGNGTNFAPAFDLANYVVVGGGFPTANIFVEEGLSSPVTKEITFAAGVQLPKGGYLKAIFTDRKVSNFVEDFATLETGTTNVVDGGVDFGTFTNQIYRNSDLPKRDYQSLQLLSSYRLTDHWSATAQWTIQLKNDGNFEGEGVNTPGISSAIGDYPELFNAARTFPDGRLNDFQRHKVRAWTNYDLDLGKAGNANLGILYRFDSALTYSLASLNQPLTAIQGALGAAYASLPSLQTVYYADRGTEFYESSHLVDVSLNYEVPIFKNARPWFKVQVRNVMNKTPLIGFNTTVSQDRNTAADNLGLRTGFTRSSAFGTARSTTDFPFPRELFVSVGFRF